MVELKQLLAKTDDDYLIGLCNKGIVKRAYKDLDKETPAVVWAEDGAEVQLSEAVCKITAPLGESTCSCPSRTVCRHIITSILRLKQEGGQTGDGGDETIESSAAEAVSDSQTQTEPESSGPAVMAELLAIDLAKLKRACGAKRFNRLLIYMESGDIPIPEESSVITYVLPWEQVTVKLLEPLEYATCSCHSKELCTHKAQAVLLYQFQKGNLTLEQMKDQEEQEEQWDLGEIQAAAAEMKEAVLMQMQTGLSRMSPEMADSMERMAVISHRAGLADFESRFREISAEYKLYFSRSASFRIQNLTGRLLKLYRMALQLEQTQNQRQISKLAGSFRETYVQLPKLHLMGIGSRYFYSKTGYEGEVYYFLELEKKQWYTWTDARPTFYEGRKSRYYGNTDKAQAPWGLTCSREQMMDMEIYLTGAKAALGGRLSSSKETKSEIIGTRNKHQNNFHQMIYQDFHKLLEDLFADGKSGSYETSRLALVKAVRCESTVFDTISQVFQIKLFDAEERMIPVTVRYTKKEKLLIQVLERLERRIRKRDKKPPIFFGILYLEEGQLHMYPIEFFEMEISYDRSIEGDRTDTG